MRQPWDPDPLHIEPEPVEPIVGPRSTPGITVPLTVLLAIVITAIVLIVSAASRGAPEHSPAPALLGTPSPIAEGLGRGPGIATEASAVPGEDTPIPIETRLAGDGAAAGLNPPAATPTVTSHVYHREGFISHMGAGYPTRYLALPCKHGNVRCHLTVRLCGPADCVTLRQTDYGPSQKAHPDRIADVSVAMFEKLCGIPARLGLCNGSWTTVAGGPRPTLPATDSQEGEP